MPKTWGSSEDAKLAEPFQRGPRNGGIFSKDITSEAIKNVRLNHFSDRSYKIVVVLFQNKAHAWNINHTLAQSRGKLYIMALTCNFTTILSHILFYSKIQTP